MMREIFPFCAIIGQQDLKLCLLLNAVHPRIGGVLIRGEKGTAKSTIVRGFADILPGTSVVTLPLNATEDRVTGGMDFNRAVKEGKKNLLPGLLYKANKAILYVDEINLLDDHIVDIILDAAGSRENRVEREGLSFCHEADFFLVGTMNPEEGDLRPQLLDRFGLCVEVVSEKDPEARVNLIEQRELYDRDPQEYINNQSEQTGKLVKKIENAKKILPVVRLDTHLRAFIAELCTNNNVAGHRADIVIEQAARAHAAMLGQTSVTIDDISMVAKFALLHRKQEADHPPPQPPPPDDKNRESEEENSDQKDLEDPEDNRADNPEDQPGDESEDQHDQENKQNEEQASLSESGSNDQAQADNKDNKDSDEVKEKDVSIPKEDVQEQIFEAGATFKVKKITTVKDRKMRRGSGRRSRTRISQKQGRYVKSGMQRVNNDIAFDATLRAAAPYQIKRDIPKGLYISLKPEDIREKIREKRIGNFLIFLVDASGSMGAQGRMAASKGAILSLLLDAYQKRDKVAMVSFRKKEAYINLPPTSSIELAADHLEKMPIGGRTPLSAGLAKAYHMIENVLIRDPATRPIMIIITDGKSNVAMGEKKPMDEAMMFAMKMGLDERIKYIVVDTEPDGIVRFGLAGKLAAAANAQYCKIDDLKSDSLVSVVKGIQ